MHTYIFNKLDHKVWRLKKLYPIIRHAEHFKRESWSITSSKSGFFDTRVLIVNEQVFNFPWIFPIANSWLCGLFTLDFLLTLNATRLKWMRASAHFRCCSKFIFFCFDGGAVLPGYRNQFSLYANEQQKCPKKSRLTPKFKPLRSGLKFIFTSNLA